MANHLKLGSGFLCNCDGKLAGKKWQKYCRFITHTAKREKLPSASAEGIRGDVWLLCGKICDGHKQKREYFCPVNACKDIETMDHDAMMAHMTKKHNFSNAKLTPDAREMFNYSMTNLELLIKCRKDEEVRRQKQ